MQRKYQKLRNFSQPLQPFFSLLPSVHYQFLKARGKHHLTAVGAVAANSAISSSPFLERTGPMNRRRRRMGGILDGETNLNS